MGYAKTVGSNYLRLNSTSYNGFHLGTVPANITIASIYIPYFEGDLLCATLEVTINQVRDTSGAFNYNNSDTAIQINTSGGWVEALWMAPRNISAPANSTVFGGHFYGTYNTVVGDENIASYLTKGSELAVRWNNASALADDLYCYGVFTHINLYFK